MKKQISESQNTLDIVQLIEHNPITRLNKTYEHKFIQKIKNNFTENQQQMFAASFYSYLNYNSKTDFVIDMDLVWKWLGFDRKGKCKELLVKHFTIDIDYKLINKSTNKIYGVKLASPAGEEKTLHTNLETKSKTTKEEIVLDDHTKKAASPTGEGPYGSPNLGEETIFPLQGKNKIEETRGRKQEQILMNIITFKKLCLKSNAKKADEVHDYFIKLEEIFHEILNEESSELKLQLKQNELVYTKEKEQIWKNSFRNKYVVYLIIINEFLIKFGFTKDFDGRLSTHKTDYGKKIQIAFIIESKNNEMLETLFKNHERIKPNRISQEFNGENKTELIKLDKDLSLKNIISILTDTNKFIDTVLETQVFKKYNIDINYTKEEENVPVKEVPIKKVKEENVVKKEVKKVEKQVKVKSKAELVKIENEVKIIKEYLEAKTIKSNFCNDAISMKNLYSKFCEWINIVYPNENIVKQRVFTTRMKSTNNVNYDNSIFTLKSTSGITNIKFK